MPSINSAYAWAIDTCNAPNIEYSQGYRNQQVVNGITYYDCSSFINYALIAGGWSTPEYAPNNNPFTTSNMGAVLLELGFTQYSISDSFQWLPGDIGWRVGHCEMCYKAGTGTAVFMGAHTDEWAPDEQVSINPSETTFTICYRYGEGGAEEPHINPYVIAAMCGNFWTESNINPGVWERLEPASWTSLRHGYGIGQWTNTDGDTQGRLYQLHEWLMENGYADDSLEGQLKYISVENTWHTGGSYQQEISYKSLSDFLNSDSEDLDYLTKAWLFCWEGINNGTLEERQGHARACYDYIMEHASDTDTTPYTASNSYLSESQILNNAIWVYRLMGGGSGENPQPVTRHKMPIWMMIRRRW